MSKCEGNLIVEGMEFYLGRGKLQIIIIIIPYNLIPMSQVYHNAHNEISLLAL